MRIIRAVRFAPLSGLGFGPGPQDRRALAAQGRSTCWPRCRKAACSTKCSLLQTGRAGHRGAAAGSAGPAAASTRCWTWWWSARRPLVHAALQDTDRRLAEGKRGGAQRLLACVLWHDAARRLAAPSDARTLPALQDAIDEVFDQRIGDVSGRGKLAADMREIWVMQPCFESAWPHPPSARRNCASARVLTSQPARRRGRSGRYLADWWQKFSTADEDERYGPHGSRRAKSKRPAARPRAISTAATAPEAADPRGLALTKAPTTTPP